MNDFIGLAIFNKLCYVSFTETIKFLRNSKPIKGSEATFSSLFSIKLMQNSPTWSKSKICLFVTDVVASQQSLNQVITLIASVETPVLLASRSYMTLS